MPQFLTLTNARIHADRIVEELFRNGAGQEADRLVLTIDGPPTRDLGGYSRRGAADLIVALLTGERDVTPTQRAETVIAPESAR